MYNVYSIHYTYTVYTTNDYSVYCIMYNEIMYTLYTIHIQCIRLMTSVYCIVYNEIIPIHFGMNARIARFIKCHCAALPLSHYYFALGKF